MATTTTDIAAKAAKYREMAKDKALPQDVRNAYLDKANKLEEGTMKPTMAKGGMVAKAPAKKMAMGGMVPLSGQQEAMYQQQRQAAQPQVMQTTSISSTAKPSLARTMQGQEQKAAARMAQQLRSQVMKAEKDAARQAMKAPKQTASPIPVGAEVGGRRDGMGGGYAKGGSVVAKAPAKKPAMKGPAVVIAVGMTKKPTKMNKGGMAKGKC